MVSHLAVLAKPRTIVYSPTSVEGYTRAFETKTPAKPVKNASSDDSVLSNK
jgi:hypothetical protein